MFSCAFGTSPLRFAQSCHRCPQANANRFRGRSVLKRLRALFCYLCQPNPNDHAGNPVALSLSKTGMAYALPIWRHYASGKMHSAAPLHSADTPPHGRRPAMRSCVTIPYARAGYAWKTVGLHPRRLLTTSSRIAATWRCFGTATTGSRCARRATTARPRPKTAASAGCDWHTPIGRVRTRFERIAVASLPV